MVSFEPLDIDEADAFLEASIRSFLAERVPADQVTDENLERVRQEVRQRLLPHGTLTSDHRFEAIVSGRERVGRVWFGPLQGSDTGDLADPVLLQPTALLVEFGTQCHVAILERVSSTGRADGGGLPMSAIGRAV